MIDVLRLLRLVYLPLRIVLVIVRLGALSGGLLFLALIVGVVLVAADVVAL